MIGAVILAGGQSRRMGGGDKALMPLGPGTVLGHVITRLTPQVGALALNANGDPARFAHYGLPVLPDSFPGFAGPLAGVLTALDWAQAQGWERVLTVAADTPFLPPDLAPRLATPGGLTLAESVDAQGDPRLHPTAGLWPVVLRAALARALEAGERRIGKWALAQGAQRVRFAGVPDPFENLNTPEDLARAEALLRS